MIRAAFAVALLCAAVAVPAPHAAAHDSTCTGISPALNSCSAGTHVRGGEFIQHGPDFDASSLFTGRIESYLISGDGKNAKLSCDILLGERQHCFGDPFNRFPNVGESFDHICVTRRFGSEDGSGIGPWGCRVSHA